MTSRLAATFVVVLIVSALAPLAPAAPATPRGRTIIIEADAIAVDARTSTAFASGRVRISDGVRTATAARATIYQSQGRGVLTDGAVVTDPFGAISGNEITVTFTAVAITHIVARGSAGLETSTTLVNAEAIHLVPSTELVTAERQVTVFTKPDIIATGARLTYARARGQIALEGPVRTQSADGFIEGQRMDGDERLKRLLVTGDVHAVYRDLDVRSRTAEVFGDEKRATFVGDVRVVQPGRAMTTDRLTVWYAAGRVLAEGPTRMRFEPTP
jgi:lipopolysaccharide export system protein LptA